MPKIIGAVFGNYDIMSEKEKEATPQAAFTFLEPLVSEQSAKQTVERVSAGS